MNVFKQVGKLAMDDVSVVISKSIFFHLPNANILVCLTFSPVQAVKIET